MALCIYSQLQYDISTMHFASILTLQKHRTVLQVLKVAAAPSAFASNALSAYVAHARDITELKPSEMVRCYCLLIPSF